MKRALLMRRAAFAAAAILGLAVASPAFAGISDLAINGDASLASSDLQVTVTGTVSCPVGETAVINAFVNQIVHGQVLSQAFGNTGNITCAGAAVLSWTVSATTSVPLQNGPAHALATAFAFGPGSFENALTSAEVHLQEH